MVLPLKMNTSFSMLPGTGNEGTLMSMWKLEAWLIGGMLVSKIMFGYI
jgi:hypothetical protein